MIAPTQPAGEDVLSAMAEVMERQARVARAEATLSAAQRRLGDSLVRLRRVASERGEGVELPPLAAAALQLDMGIPATGAANEERPGTLRARIVAVMEASPDEVFTPARLAPMVGSQNRDSIRNTLLVLAAQGLIDKRGVGLYQARKSETPPAPAEESAP